MKNNRKNLTKKQKKIIGLFFIIFIICILYLFFYFYKFAKNKEVYHKLYSAIENSRISDKNKDKENEVINSIKGLQQINNDIKGWIQISDTNINYPLLQTTNNDYYLSHNYNKESSSYGSIFINKNSDLNNSNSNIIIYGHNMDDGQMFNNLLKYESKEYYDNHQDVTLITENGIYKYKIVYVFKSRIFYQDEANVFRYYQYYNFNTESLYNEYIQNCEELSLYDTFVKTQYGEQLITLITCEYSQENGRMVVVAKKINTD